jgi:molybdate transport system substrate-binding protein
MAKAAAQFRVKQPSVSATITFLEVAMKLPHRRRFLRLAAGAVRTLAVVLALVASGVAQIAAVQAADINAFISTAIKAVTDELLPPFERANGHTIRASYAPSGALLPRFERGEPVDVFLTDAPAIDRLIQQGKIVGGRIDLARTGIGICVRKGAPRLDVSTARSA